MRWASRFRRERPRRECSDYRDPWFVVHVPPDPVNQDPIALLAVQDETGVCDGFFASDRERALAIDEYVAERL